MMFICQGYFFVFTLSPFFIIPRRKIKWKSVYIGIPVSHSNETIPICIYFRIIWSSIKYYIRIWLEIYLQCMSHIIFFGSGMIGWYMYNSKFIAELFEFINAFDHHIKPYFISIIPLCVSVLWCE